VRTIQGLLTDPFPEAKILPLFLREPLLLSEALRTDPRLFTPDFLETTSTVWSTFRDGMPVGPGVGVGVGVAEGSALGDAGGVVAAKSMGPA